MARGLPVATSDWLLLPLLLVRLLMLVMAKLMSLGVSSTGCIAEQHSLHSPSPSAGAAAAAAAAAGAAATVAVVAVETLLL
jgi:hypothetical protein